MQPLGGIVCPFCDSQILSSNKTSGIAEMAAQCCISRLVAYERGLPELYNALFLNTV